MAEKLTPLKLNKCAGCNGTLYQETFEIIPTEAGVLKMYCPVCALLVKAIEKEIDKLQTILEKVA